VLKTAVKTKKIPRNKNLSYPGDHFRRDARNLGVPPYNLEPGHFEPGLLSHLDSSPGGELSRLEKSK